MMENISFPLLMITFAAQSAVLVYFPRAPTALRDILALLVVALGLAALFWPIRVPISHELLVAIELVAAISVVALGAVAMLRIMSRVIAEAKARGS
jgi:hypothetical protein